MNAKTRCVAVGIATAACLSIAWGQSSTSTPAPGAQTPAPQPQTSPPAAAPVPARDQAASPTPAQTTPDAADTAAADRARPADESKDDTEAPPRRLAEGDDGTTDGIGDGRECTRLRGLEKAECQRRDNPRDDLPAGVTSTEKAERP